MYEKTVRHKIKTRRTNKFGNFFLAHDSVTNKRQANMCAFSKNMLTEKFLAGL